MCYGLPFGELRLKDEIARQLLEEASEDGDDGPEGAGAGADGLSRPERGENTTREGPTDTTPSFLEERGETDVTIRTGDAAEE